ncbi:MAG: hypothetical protein JSV42_01815 [Chloroflexota bacterium]|nr:MAG: hypothetical protein JSV42_01815 [Chloroflexota bacterium]
MLVYYLLVLRLVHIVASVCWVGGAFIFFLFIEPTAKALAPSGMEFVQYMVTKRRFSIFMVIASSLTVLSGALLIWQSASGQWSEYISTGPGLGFTLGSIVGALVYLVGMFGVNPRAIKMAKIGQEIEAAGGPPTPAQSAEMQKLDKEMSILGTIDFVLVALSLALMATARYWLF